LLIGLRWIVYSLNMRSVLPTAIAFGVMRLAQPTTPGSLGASLEGADGAKLFRKVCYPAAYGAEWNSEPICRGLVCGSCREEQEEFALDGGEGISGPDLVMSQAIGLRADPVRHIQYPLLHLCEIRHTAQKC